MFSTRHELSTALLIASSTATLITPCSAQPGSDNPPVAGCERHRWTQMCPRENLWWPAYFTDPGPVPIGNDYGELNRIYHPQWFYFRMGDAGYISFQLSSSNHDVDYAMWGPFDTLDQLQEQCGSYGSPISDSYHYQAVEPFTVHGLVAGAWYALLVSNYARVVQNFNLQAISGTATIDCTAIAQSSTPTSEPTEDPTSTPTSAPTSEPTADPTHNPTEEPTLTPVAAIARSSSAEEDFPWYWLFFLALLPLSSLGLFFFSRRKRLRGKPKMKHIFMSEAFGARYRRGLDEGGPHPQGGSNDSSNSDFELFLSSPLPSGVDAEPAVDVVDDSGLTLDDDALSSLLQNIDVDEL